MSTASLIVVKLITSLCFRRPLGLVFASCRLNWKVADMKGEQLRAIPCRKAASEKARHHSDSVRDSEQHRLLVRAHDLHPNV